MIKPRISYRNGRWWCRRLWVTGCGATPLDAWNDMWALYHDAVRRPIPAVRRPIPAVCYARA